MSSNLVYVVIITVFLSSCETGEKEALRSTVDSLRTELERSQENAQTLLEIGGLLDSIDATRQVLRVNLVEGTPYDDYSGRMKDLHEYVRATEEKIAQLEENIRSSGANAQALSKSVRQLRAELNKKEKQMAFLQDEVEEFRRQNENLLITVNLQDAEIADKQEQIEAKTQELALIEARVQELMIQAKVSEADAYYTRAMAIETAAERTRLAPRKKRETLREALEYYKKALSLGKTEAQAKIDELERRL